MTAVATKAKTRSAPSIAIARARPVARSRRLAAAVMLLLPPVLVVGTDVARRTDRLLHMGPRGTSFYLACVAASFALWTALLVVAARRRGVARWAARFVVLVAAALA